jgi:hypothetical protein
MPIRDFDRNIGEPRLPGLAEAEGLDEHGAVVVGTHDSHEPHRRRCADRLELRRLEWARTIARRVLEPRLGPELFARYYAWREAFHCGMLPSILADARSPWFGASGRDDLLGAALDDAIAELEERLGPDRREWRWGALHRARFAAPLARMAHRHRTIAVRFDHGVRPWFVNVVLIGPDSARGRAVRPDDQGRSARGR